MNITNILIRAIMNIFCEGWRLTSMRIYDDESLKNMMLPMETVYLIGKINEYKGKQDLYKEQASQILDTLKR